MSWDYRLEPEEPEPCCSRYEDEGHDSEQCLADGAEAAAEAKAERIREDRMLDDEAGYWSYLRFMDGL